MTFRYRLFIILIITWIAISFNIERPDSLLINIASFVYVLGILSMFVLLIFLQMANIRLRYVVAPILLLYVVGKALTVHGDIEAARFAYIVFTEVTILFVLVFLAKALAMSIGELHTTLEESLIQAERPSVLDTMQGELAIRRKIERARRFNRNLAIIHVSINSLNGTSRRQWDQEEKMKFLYSQVQISELMDFLVDATDISMWHNNNLVVCVQQSSKENAQKQAKQIQQVLRDVMGLDTEVGISLFPEDGLIYRDMLRTSRINKLA